MNNDILIIIVLYNTKLLSSPSYCSLSGQISVDSFFIFDNSPEPMISEDEVNTTGVMYEHDRTNPGLGHAYNTGARIASKLGKKWILLADQDTIFSTDFFSFLHQCFSNAFVLSLIFIRFSNTHCLTINMQFSNQ